MAARIVSQADKQQQRPRHMRRGLCYLGRARQTQEVTDGETFGAVRGVLRWLQTAK